MTNHRQVRLSTPQLPDQRRGMLRIEAKAVGTCGPVTEANVTWMEAKIGQGRHQVMTSFQGHIAQRLEAIALWLVEGCLSRTPPSSGPSCFTDVPELPSLEGDEIFTDVHRACSDVQCILKVICSSTVQVWRPMDDL